MKRAILFAVILGACGSDSTPVQTTPDAPGGTMVTNVTTDVTADTTWSGTIRVQNSISIDAGVTLTVSAGTSIEVASTASIDLKGTMTVAGTKASKVTFAGLGGDYWGDIDIPSGGSFSMEYGVWTGGEITIVTGATFMLRDSELSGAGHDLITASGGNLDIQYSWLGVATGGHDTTHCDTHFEGGDPTITLSHSNISTAVYGMMFYSGTNLDFTYDNWFSNSIQVDTTTGVTGDFSNGWFDKSPPSGPGITANNMASAMISDAGPR